MSEFKEIYIYNWNVTEENYKTILRCYGLNKYSQSICLIIQNYRPFIYLDSTIEWSKNNILKLFNLIYDNQSFKFPTYEIVSKKKIYFNDPENISLNNWSQRTYNFLKCYFNSKSAIHYFLRLLTQKDEQVKSLNIKYYENKVNPILQFTTMFNIPTIGWINTYVEPNKNIETNCDEEWILKLPYKWPFDNKHIKKIHHVSRSYIPNFTILSFDIEVYSHDNTKLPSPYHPYDRIFQISCVLFSNNIQVPMKKILLSLGNTENISNDIEIRNFSCEEDLIIGFSKLIKSLNIHIIIGYNIFGFDLDYIIKRSEKLLIFNELVKISFHNHNDSKKNTYFSPIIRKSVKNISNEDKTYYLESEGKVFIDLFTLIMKQYDLPNYKLKTVARHFIGQSKDPLDVIDIFICYEEAILYNSIHGPKLLSKVGKYCIQDSVLVAELFKKLECLTYLTELAYVCRVPIEYLYLKGEQVKVYSQIYNESFHMGFVIEDCPLSDRDKYDGATVIEPKPGLYKNVIPFDFASLYPTTMISFNIDYTTCIHIDNMDKVPLDKCNVITWKEHNECIHIEDIYNCKEYRFMFLKEPKGIIPTLLEKLLEARRNTRNEMKLLKEQLSKTNESNTILLQQISILEKRQLAFKLSANSVYGFLGVKDGYLPFKPLAMCTTAKGREMIMKAADFLRLECNGTLIYGDTDSNMIHFPHLEGQPNNMIWKYCEQIENEFEQRLPKPMKLEFEQKVYHYFLIFKKKKYSFIEMNCDGSLSKIKSKGLLNVRRDNCMYIQQLYTSIITHIFNNQNIEYITSFLFQEIIQLFTFKTKFIDEFIMTKIVKPTSSYVKKYLPQDEQKKTKRLQSLHCNEEDFFSKSLPAHIQLVEKMKKRGIQVQMGDRIEYVIIKNNYYTKLFEKCEDIDYFKRHSDILNIDYMYYLEQSIDVIDEIFILVFKKPVYQPIIFLLKQKEKILKELMSFFYGIHVHLSN